MNQPAALSDAVEKDGSVKASPKHRLRLSQYMFFSEDVLSEILFEGYVENNIAKKRLFNPPTFAWSDNGNGNGYLTVTMNGDCTTTDTMDAIGHHGQCQADPDGSNPFISCTALSAAALSAAIGVQPSPGIATITIAVATSLMAATSMIFAVAWFFNWRRRPSSAPIYASESGDEALLGGVN